MIFCKITSKIKIINVVHRSGSHKGTDNSLNILSNSQIKNMFIAILKAPRVSILKGRVIDLTIGFIKKFISPKAMPKTKKICHCWVKDIPKKLDSGYNFTVTSGTNKSASQSPKEAAAT